MARRFRNSKAVGWTTIGITTAAAFIAAEQFNGSDPGLPARAPVPGGYLQPDGHLPDPMEGRETDCTVDADNYFDQPLDAPYRLSDAPIVPRAHRASGSASQAEFVATTPYETRPIEMSEALWAVEDAATERMFEVFQEYCDQHNGTFEGSTEDILALQAKLTVETLRMIDEQIEVVRTLGKHLPDSAFGEARQWIVDGNIELLQSDRRDYERLLYELNEYGFETSEGTQSEAAQLV
jgi:hypothetical protein